jgi:NADH-quinone oxidoreductase subunit N
MSAAPFHMWAPDVYQGAPTVITAFFASAPKVAALAITLRFLMQPLLSLAPQWQQVTIAAAVASMLVGAVAALRQTNIKRLLAYSSIGHVGYLLMGISSGNVAGIQSVLLYLAIYIAMTLGAFGVLLQLKRDKKPVEDLDDLKGLATREPLMAAVLSILMLSMAGIPPFAGFFAKFYVFLSAMEEELYVLAVIGVLSSVIAAFYYLKIIKLMYFDEVKLPLDNFIIARGHKLVIGITTLFTMLYFLYPTPLIQIAREAARSLIK